MGIYCVYEHQIQIQRIQRKKDIQINHYIAFIKFILFIFGN